MSDFGEALKAWRKAYGLTQKEAADRLGANLRTYQNWEAGVNTPPKITENYVRSRIEAKPVQP